MGGGKTTTTQKSTVEIPQEIRDRGTKITNAAMGNYFDPSQKHETFNYNQYQGVGKDTTGQLNNFHTQAGNQYQNAATSYQPYIDRANSAITSAANGSKAQNVNGPNFTQANVQRFMNPYQDLVINQGLSDISRGLNTQRLQNQTSAARAGAFGGARHGVIDAESQRTAADTAQRFVGEQLNSGYGQAVNQYNTDFSQGLQATSLNNAAAGQNFTQGATYSQILANLGQQQQTQQMNAGDKLLGLGNVKTAQEQAQKDNAYNKGYLDKRGYPMDIYERLAAINAMQPVNRTSTTVGTERSSGGWLGPALGAGAQILAAASDERAKENIADIDPEEVLGAFSRVPPKSYTYKQEALDALPELTRPGKRTGFMAQDLERAFGKPSGPTIKGVKTVDIAEVMGNLVTAVHGLEKRTRGLKVRT